MIRGIPKRAVALLGTLFFLLTTAGEGFGLHPCPYHDAIPGAAGESHTSAGHHGHHAGHDNPASPEQHESHHHQSQHAAADEEEASGGHHSDAEPCTHVEACQPPSGAVAPEHLADGLTWIHRTASEAIIAPAERLATSYPPHFLPYAQAPPARG